MDTMPLPVIGDDKLSELPKIHKNRLKKSSKIQKGLGSSFSAEYNSIDENVLLTQFQYFRKEFVDLILSSGITIPLDIMEDSSGAYSAHSIN